MLLERVRFLSFAHSYNIEFDGPIEFEDFFADILTLLITTLLAKNIGKKTYARGRIQRVKRRVL